MSAPTDQFPRDTHKGSSPGPALTVRQGSEVDVAERHASGMIFSLDAAPAEQAS
jgi:hypothetical protein